MAELVQKPIIDIGGKARAFKQLLRKNRVARGLFMFVAVPTILATFYYIFIASDIYVSESKFSVNVEGHSQSPVNGLGGLIAPSLAASSNLYQSMVVKDFVESPGILPRLEKDVNIREIYDNDKADFLSRIPKSATQERFMRAYVGDKLEIIPDEVSGILTMRVSAYSPKDANRLSNAILHAAEDFVNDMADRVQDDAVKFSKKQLDQAEQNIIKIDEEMKRFRNENNNFNPTATASGIVGISTDLEKELAKVNAEIASVKNYMRADSPKVQALEAKARAIEEQIGEQNSRLAGDKGSKLADITQEYETLILKKTFAAKKYEVLMSSFESAQAEARKKSKYLLRVVEPSLPQEAVKPRRAREIFTVFMSCLIAYTLGSLIVAGIKDHMRI